MAMRQTDGSTVIPRSSSDQNNFQYGLDGFLKEARTLARFREPNIIRVQGFLEANGTAYMVMDYEEGESLDALLKREGTLDEAEVKAIIIPILDGLRAVHQAEFLHRDIKPGNIYLRKDGPPVLIDFGAARQALGEHSRSMTGIVTAGYAPFEQYSSRGRQGPWTDIYAIGATLYRCISGHVPVEASERIAAMGEDEPDPLIPATELGKEDYSQPLLEAIDWMLRPAVKDRPRDITPILEILLGKSSQLQKSQSMTSSATSSKSEKIVSSSSTLEKKGKGTLILIVGLVFLVLWLIISDHRTEESLSDLEDDYSKLKVKYDKLFKPGRNSKNKYVVDFRYTSQLGDDRFIIKRPKDNEFSLPQTLDDAESLLQSVVIDYCKDLYVRIVFPQSEPLSHQKAWQLTSRLHEYDYYHRTTPCE